VGLVPAVKKLSSSAIDAGENSVEVSKLLLYNTRNKYYPYYHRYYCFKFLKIYMSAHSMNIIIRISFKLHIADEIVYFWIKSDAFHKS